MLGISVFQYFGLYTPDLVPLGGLGNGAPGGFHALSELFDFGLALGLISLAPLDAILDIAAEGTALWVGKDAGPVEGWRCCCCCCYFCCYFCCCRWFWIPFSPVFPAIVQSDGQRFARLGSRFGPSGIPAILETVSVGVCMGFAMCRSHCDRCCCSCCCCCCSLVSN